MKRTQYDRLAALLKRGTTSMKMIRVAGTVSPHSRLAEMKRRGWRIWRKAIPGKSHRGRQVTSTMTLASPEARRHRLLTKLEGMVPELLTAVAALRGEG